MSLSCRGEDERVARLKFAANPNGAVAHRCRVEFDLSGKTRHTVNVICISLDHGHPHVALVQLKPTYFRLFVLPVLHCFSTT